MSSKKMISKWYVVAGVLLLTYGAGYMQGKGNKEIQIKEVVRAVVDEDVREKEITLPDGSVVVYREIKRRSETNISRETITNPKRQWGITILGPLTSHVKKGATWTIAVDKRILPDLFAGVYARFDGELGFSLRYEF